MVSTISGGYREGETPLPIPNRAVKPLSADGTWPFRPGRVGRRRFYLKDEGSPLAAPSSFRHATELRTIRGALSYLRLDMKSAAIRLSKRRGL